MSRGIVARSLRERVRFSHSKCIKDIYFVQVVVESVVKMRLMSVRLFDITQPLLNPQIKVCNSSISFYKAFCFFFINIILLLLSNRDYPEHTYRSSVVIFLFRKHTCSQLNIFAIKLNTIQDYIFFSFCSRLFYFFPVI